MAAACVVAGAACDGAERAQDGAESGGAGRPAAEGFGQEDYRVFARSDSARGGGDGAAVGTIGGLPDAEAPLAEVGGDALGAVQAGPAEGTPSDEERPAAQDPGAGDGTAQAGRQGPGASDETLASLPDAAGQSALPAPATVAAGTRVRVVLDEEVSAERHLPGHAVIATVVANVTGPEGELLIGEGAKLLGRVAASEPSPGPGEDAHLEIAFETLSAHGFERPLHAVLAGGARPDNPFGGFVEPRPYQGRIRAGTPLILEIRAAFAAPRQAADTLPPAGHGSGHAR